MAPADATLCPYVGLQPFTEEHRDYFFGRDRDVRIVASNLYAVSLTVLYGASGVGKSSVLLAGVVPFLRNKPHIAVVMFRQWQAKTFLAELKRQCVEAADQILTQPSSLDPTLPLDDVLLNASQSIGGPMIVIFDQFEEYFLYHPETEIGNSFESEWARAINREDVEANFLVSLREDDLSKLDRFRTRIPNLLSNSMRLNHLDKTDAEKAIREPLRVYARHFPDTVAPVTPEDKLVKTVLEDVSRGKVRINELGGTGIVAAAEDTNRIETSFLQLVMTRLWNAEYEAKSPTLRLQTYKALGQAQQIVRAHLEEVLNGLKSTDRELCASLFDRMVTPSGSKISCHVRDLAQWTQSSENQVLALLKPLVQNRILRRIESISGQSSSDQYELFHDVLASAVLTWRRRHVERREQTRKRNRFIMILAAVGIALVSITYQAHTLWVENRPWGYLRNIATGSTHLLKGHLVSIGRSTETFQNQISLGVENGLSRNYSRMHLFITDRLSALDMRSLNGSTVNAVFLPYGYDRTLQDKDLLVLAGLAGFQFNRLHYSSFQFWVPAMEKAAEPHGWAVLIDGKSKTYHYLTQPEHFLALDQEKKIVIQETISKTALAGIRVRKGPVVTFEDLPDDTPLLASMKEGDYLYIQCEIPSSGEFTFWDIRQLTCQKVLSRDDYRETPRLQHSLEDVTYSYGDTSFQFILIRPEAESSATTR